MKILHCAVVTLLLMEVCCVAQEVRIPRSALPAAVEKTVQAETIGATIRAFQTEREHGQMVYEAETTVKGHTRDLQIAGNGTLLEVEEEVAFNDLPAAVQQGLTQKAAGASIRKVESLTKKGKLVAYEAATLKGSHKGEVQVGPAGETLKHSE